ncbi:MAG: PHP domain-containing protein [Methanophagales archaeon]|nr:PHP domain-containing protein [Methanophagales archaeon]
MKYDLHIHSKYSADGVLEPEKIVKIAMRVGLDGIAVTDHETIKGGVKAKKYENDDLIVIVGSEIETERGEIIGLFLEEEVKSRSLQEVIDEIKDQNGIAVVPHPFDRLRRLTFHPTEEDVKFIDCIEGFNSRCVFQRYNKRAIEYGIEHGLAITAGSDAHFGGQIGDAFILAESSDEEDLMRRIMKKEISFNGRLSNPLYLVIGKVLTQVQSFRVHGSRLDNRSRLNE